MERTEYTLVDDQTLIDTVLGLPDSARSSLETELAQRLQLALDMLEENGLNTAEGGSRDAN